MFARHTLREHDSILAGSMIEAKLAAGNQRPDGIDRGSLLIRQERRELLALLHAGLAVQCRQEHLADSRLDWLLAVGHELGESALAARNHLHQRPVVEVQVFVQPALEIAGAGVRRAEELHHVFALKRTKPALAR